MNWAKEALAYTNENQWITFEIFDLVHFIHFTQEIYQQQSGKSLVANVTTKHVIRLSNQHENKIMKRDTDVRTKMTNSICLNPVMV